MHRFLTWCGLRGERRATGERLPIFVGARLELDVVTVEGTARDLSEGGVFFQTTAPLAPGLRGALVREGARERVPVRVTWRRDARDGEAAGLGLTFE